MPRYTANNINKHGTRCGGVVAGARDNGLCGVGVAYQARYRRPAAPRFSAWALPQYFRFNTPPPPPTHIVSLGGIRMLDGPISDVVEVRAAGPCPSLRQERGDLATGPLAHLPRRPFLRVPR